MKAIIVDDEQLAINRLKKLMGSVEDVAIIGDFINPREVLEKITQIDPDIVFTDVEMPEMTGFELVKAIRSSGLNPKFIFVTAFDHYAIKAIKEQAFDYLLKPVDIDELKATIRRYLTELKLPKEKIDLLTDQYSLSERESEVLGCMVCGETSQDIAAKLFLSKHTVDTHRRNILNKVGAKNTAELIIRLSAS